MLVEKIKQRLRELIQAAAAVKATERQNRFGPSYDMVAEKQLEASCLTLMESAFGRDSSHRGLVEEAIKDSYTSKRITALTGILQATLEDLNGGYIFKARQLIEAEVAGDYLEQASALLAAGYKDPAAVLAGSVLERHLRALCAAHGVPLVGTNNKPKMTDALNNDLAAAGVYNALKAAQVRAWAALRNKAAHGEYGQYDARDVENLLRDVRAFCADVT